MPHMKLLSITARRAELLNLVSRHQTQREIADAMEITPATVKSHIDWLRAETKLRSMRELGEWWQRSRKAWLCELAETAGLEVGIEHTFTGRGTEPLKMGLLGGLTR